ncbi:Uncharacterized protein FWK35_00022043 [Aphis craccivora]|uniref:Uncharacterized protein n=1 Tax=Aphis craccivora TaxID=307492 RepID=A0A6G0Z217_APHCR|nr:Uncharacterized protein FWK35_00022043 [Aphis craccivora]
MYPQTVPLSEFQDSAETDILQWSEIKRWGFGYNCINFNTQTDFRSDEDIKSKVPNAGSNIVGKFTQSVRRIVQDVKDEGTATNKRVDNQREMGSSLRELRW